jgi:signal transduction histidine kinase
MDLSDLMEGAVSDALSVVLSWSVTDITDETGNELPAGTAGVKQIDVGQRRWQMQITPNPNSDMTPNPSAPLVVILSGLAATGVLAGALHNRQRHTADRAEYEKLREITEAKDEFLASVSHELRTPLTSVLGFAELLRGDDVELTDAERRSMIASVADEALDLAAIVEDLLVSARSELDLLVVTRVPVSARAQVAQVLEVSSKDSCAAVEVIGDPTEPYTALGDPGRVRQILRNLITNACRYGGQRVQIRLRSVDDTVVIAVADDGQGVPSGDEDRIFAPYYRAHAIESQPAALGIGLSVARQLSRLMDGDLRYWRDDGWTVFELHLPQATHPGIMGAEAMTASRLE